MTEPESSDPRSDLYALGAVGYFLLAGRPVFDGTSVAEIIGHHLHTEPAPLAARAGQAVPADLEEVILHCLRKRPEDRPRDARALRDELLRCRSAHAWTADDAARWWRSFRAAGALRSRQPVAEEPASGTVTIDVDERLTQAVTRA